MWKILKVKKMKRMLITRTDGKFQNANDKMFGLVMGSFKKFVYSRGRERGSEKKCTFIILFSSR